ncbi:MAG: phage major capsid protein, partial [Clostridiales bacterium]|nr:phage major capsid protein [Clostridiales bacterium]
MKKKIVLLRQNSLRGMEARRNFKFSSFAYLVLFAVLAMLATGMYLNPETAAGMLAAAPLVIPIIKGGVPKDVESLDQESKDALATIQKGINEALAAIELKEATPEMVEKAIDDIVSDAMNEMKSKDKNGKFSLAMKELSAYGETIKNMAAKLEKLEKGEGLDFGKKSGIEKIVDDVLNTDKFKEFADGRIKKSSGKIRFETKDVTSLTNNYDGDKLITRQSGYVREHPQPRKVNFRDIMHVETGEENMPTITFSQITKLDRNAAVDSENGILKESAFSVKEITESVRRIGTVLFISKRMLKSISWLRSWLTNRVPSWIRLAEDFQILKGDGQGNNFLGLMNQCPDFK